MQIGAHVLQDRVIVSHTVCFSNELMTFSRSPTTNLNVGFPALAFTLADSTSTGARYFSEMSVEYVAKLKMIILRKVLKPKTMMPQTLSFLTFEQQHS